MIRGLAFPSSVRSIRHLLKRTSLRPFRGSSGRGLELGIAAGRVSVKFRLLIAVDLKAPPTGTKLLEAGALEQRSSPRKQHNRSSSA